MSAQDQSKNLGTRFNKLQESVDKLLEGADVSVSAELATPDRALVFEVIGPVSNFINAARAIGLEWLTEAQAAQRVVQCVATPVSFRFGVRIPRGTGFNMCDR